MQKQGKAKKSVAIHGGDAFDASGGKAPERGGEMPLIFGPIWVRPFAKIFYRNSK